MLQRIGFLGAMALVATLWLIAGTKPGFTDPGRETSRQTTPMSSAEAAMSKRGDWHYADTPLNDIVVELQTNLNINIKLDTEALTEEGIASDSPVTASFDDLPLEVVLQHILRPMQLACFVDRDVLVVTTLTRANESLVTRVYPVYDLVVSQTSRGERFEEFEPLIRVLEEQTSGPWMTSAGEGGGITELSNAGSLVIRQTREVHREVSGLLAALRKSKRLQQMPDVPVVLPESPTTELSGGGFFGIDEVEGDSVTTSRLIETPLSPRSATVQQWQIPRVDR